MKLLINSIAVLLITAIVFTSCKKESATQKPPIQNKPPVANAGESQIILLPTDSIELRGTGTDADGRIVSYLWNITAYYSQLGKYDYYSYHTAIAKVNNLREGMYWCKLTVTDDGGLSATNQVIVRVVSPNCPCYPNPCDAFGDPCDPWDY